VSIVRWASGVMRMHEVPVVPLDTAKQLDAQPAQVGAVEDRSSSPTACSSPRLEVGDAGDRVGRRAT
jgi:hypothetical protein